MEETVQLLQIEEVLVLLMMMESESMEEGRYGGEKMPNGYRCEN